MLIPLIKKDLMIVKGYSLGVVAIAIGLPLLLAWRQPQMGGMISLLMAVLISSVAFNLAISISESNCSTFFNSLYKRESGYFKIYTVLYYLYGLLYRVFG